MLNKICCVVLLLSLSALAAADEVQIRSDSPGTHTVVKGDTLWDIAGRFLTEPWRWPEIWEVNPQIENPHLIYPGDVIRLEYREGGPVLAVDRGVADAPAARAVTGSRQTKLSPEVRSYPHDDAVPAIPIDAIRQFLIRPLVVSDQEMSRWPYVVSSYDERLITSEGDRIYVRGLGSGSGQQRYSIYRKGDVYENSAGTVLGYEAIHVGEAVVVKYGDPATAVILESNREVVNGDRLIPVSKRETSSNFIPHPPRGNVNGEIVSVVDALSEIGQYHVVVVDLGTDQGLETGNVLGVYQSGEVVNDRVKYENDQVHPFIEYLGRGKLSGEEVRLPEEFAGVLLVFRTFPRLSYALVMEATAALNIRDRVGNL